MDWLAAPFGAQEDMLYSVRPARCGLYARRGRTAEADADQHRECRLRALAVYVAVPVRRVPGRSAELRSAVDMVVGRRPLSDYNQVVADWRTSAGDRVMGRSTWKPSPPTPDQYRWRAPLAAQLSVLAKTGHDRWPASADDRLYQSCLVASAAPLTMFSYFAQAAWACQRIPQSVPAMTFSRPQTLAKVMIVSAITSGGSTTGVV